MPTKALLIALLVFFSAPSLAGLGNSPAQFGKHVAAAKASAKSAAVVAYTDSEKTLDSGTIVHEYLDANGTVFAVSWSGPFLPDLKEILGPHFDTMVAHVRDNPRAGRAPLVVQRDDVVIFSGGHMGAFKGKAWIPAQLPAGFKPAELK